jgi:hypothetical protein
MWVIVALVTKEVTMSVPKTELKKDDRAHDVEAMERALRSSSLRSTIAR